MKVSEVNRSHVSELHFRMRDSPYHANMTLRVFAMKARHRHELVKNPCLFRAAARPVTPRERLNQIVPCRHAHFPHSSHPQCCRFGSISGEATTQSKGTIQVRQCADPAGSASSLAETGVARPAEARSARRDLRRRGRADPAGQRRRPPGPPGHDPGDRERELAIPAPQLNARRGIAGGAAAGEVPKADRKRQISRTDGGSNGSSLHRRAGIRLSDGAPVPVRSAQRGQNLPKPDETAREMHAEAIHETTGGARRVRTWATGRAHNLASARRIAGILRSIAAIDALHMSR